jgi:ABC-type multidrug transport system fused ATPase/permease subunit
MEHLSELFRSRGSINRVISLFDLNSPKTNIEKFDLKTFNHSIQIKNLYFKYNKDLVLKNINLTIFKNEKIAIVGPTGCGKTTLISLIAGFYDHFSGEILYDNYNINNISSSSLYNLIGLINQDLNIFDTTILENLRLYNKDISEELIYSSLDELNLNGFFDSFNNKLNTKISENSTNISYGQKQIISILRTLLFKKDIIIFDEATSSVDPFSEHKIQNSLDKLFKNRTAIIIAHRLSTIVNADKIIYMENGEIKEIGTHTELLSKKGYYFKLFNSNKEKIK